MQNDNQDLNAVDASETEIVRHKQGLPEVTLSGPAHLVQMAVAQNADIEKLEKLMEMQERWEANEARKSYALAISAFRNDCPAIERARKGHNAKYSGLAETIEQIQPVLSDHGLSHSWRTSQDGSAITVTCTVTHSLGHSESTSLTSLPDSSGSKQQIQAIGSTISYLERYSLYAILGLASREMDNDGDAISQAITEDQAMTIEALIEEVGADKDKLLAWGKVSRVMDIPAKNYKQVVTMLERKRNVR